MKVIYFSNSGLRKKNEDSLLINDKIINLTSNDEPIEVEIQSKGLHIFAIADGIGGRPGGEIASRVVLETIKIYKDLIAKQRIDELLKKLLHALQNEYQKNIDLEGMGTTVTAIVLQNQSCYLFHIGDTRIYSWDEKSFSLLTRDHTHVQDLVDRGFLKQEDIIHHPMQGFLKSALTTNIDVEKLEYQYDQFLLENKNFFLCSDGVWEILQDKKLKQILHSQNNYYQIAKKISKKCFDANPQDNFSFIMLINDKNLKNI